MIQQQQTIRLKTGKGIQKKKKEKLKTTYILISRKWINEMCFYLLLLIFYSIYLLEGILLLFSHSVISNTLQPHGLWHARLPCPSPSICSG